MPTPSSRVLTDSTFATDSEWTNFTDHYQRPPYAYDREPFFSFGLGGSGSGVPFHTHGAVFAEVLHGRKRWFVAQPGRRPMFSPDETSLRWLHAANQRGGVSVAHPEVRECTLGPGEALYLGTQWWHSTLNIGQTVFISTFI